MDGDTVTAAEIAVIVNRLDNFGDHLTAMERRLNHKLDQLADAGEEREKRISALERWRAYIIGGGAVALLLFGSGAAWVSMVLR